MTGGWSALEGRLARVHAILEGVEALPCGLRRFVATARRVDRRLSQLHAWNVARAVRENRPRRDAHDQLRPHRLADQRIVLAHRRCAIDAQAPRLAVHGDEQDSDVWIDQYVVQA